MVVIVCLSMVAALPYVTMTSTLRRSNSAAISLTRSDLPWAQRYSIARLSPSLQPSSRKRAVKATVHGAHTVAWLLCFRGQRPRANEATNDFYEFPPLHGFPPS